MIKYYLTTSLLLLPFIALKAQYISPTDLLQMHKLWQINDPHCDRNTYEYLLTVDKNWVPTGKPTNDEKGYTSIIGYSKDRKTWYQPNECQIMLSLDRGTMKKAMAYTFTETETWKQYNQQMIIMNATQLGSGPSNGGKQTIYQINDIVFILAEFPPGVNGNDRSYQVLLLRGD
ncbi:MAG TPA: hypothetical protein VGN20_10365 [Mucilaginibacter sp.]|jgi:hypothetical protein